MKSNTITFLITLIFILSAQFLHADEPTDDELIGELEAGLSAVDEDLQALEGALGDEEADEDDPGDEETAVKGTYYCSYSYWKPEADEEMPIILKPGTAMTYSGAMPVTGPDERNVFWVMQIDYKVKSYSNRKLINSFTDIHMLRLKKGEDAKAAIRKVVEQYRTSVGEKGRLTKAFLREMAKKLNDSRCDEILKFEVENLGGPYSNPYTAAKGPLADSYLDKGLGEIGRPLQRGDYKYSIKIIWDNPIRNKNTYQVFWK